MTNRIITETWPRVQEAYNTLPRHVSGMLQGIGITLQNLQDLDLQELQNLQNIAEQQRTPQQQQRLQELQNLLALQLETQNSINTIEGSFYNELDRRAKNPDLLNLYVGLKDVEVRPHRFYLGNRQNFLQQLIRELLQQTQVNVDGWNLQQLPFNLDDLHYTLYANTVLENDIQFGDRWYQFTNQHREFADRLPPNTYRRRRENNVEMISIETGNGNLTITRYGLRVRPNYLLQVPPVLVNVLENRRRFFDQIADEIYGIRRIQVEQPQPRRRFRGIF